MKLENLSALKGKEGFEVKFIHLHGELEGYIESFIIVSVDKVVKVISSDDPYHDVVMMLDVKAYQEKIDSCEIECQLTDDRTFKGIEILDYLNLKD